MTLFLSKIMDIKIYRKIAFEKNTLTIHSPIIMATFIFGYSSESNAHVKWFTEFNLNSPPRHLTSILLEHNFLSITLITTLIMFIVAYVDRHLVHRETKINKLLDLITHKAEDKIPTFLRLGVCIFLLCIANMGGTILTPELATSANWISFIQVFLALMALNQRTSAITGLGILFLYAFSVKEYGFFHILDYPIFIGIAIYLILISVKGVEKHITAIAILRITTGATLLWASVEKWAFPEWSFQIMENMPEMSMGLNRELFMILAGFVEFCAAFVLITGYVAARASALLLFLIFTSAIFSFGYIDAVGHSGIIVVLVILFFSNNTIAAKFDYDKSLHATALLNSCWYIAAICLFFLLYYIAYYSEYSIQNT